MIGFRSIAVDADHSLPEPGATACLNLERWTKALMTCVARSPQSGEQPRRKCCATPQHRPASRLINVHWAGGKAELSVVRVLH